MKTFVAYWLKSLEEIELCDLLNTYLADEKTCYVPMRYYLDSLDVWQNFNDDSFDYGDSLVIITIKEGTFEHPESAWVISLSALDLSNLIERLANAIVKRGITLDDLKLLLRRKDRDRLFAYYQVPEDYYKHS